MSRFVSDEEMTSVTTNRKHIEMRLPVISISVEPNICYIWRCGGSLVALQTTETVVPGSNPASLTVENSEDRQNHFIL